MSLHHRIPNIRRRWRNQCQPSIQSACDTIPNPLRTCSGFAEPTPRFYCPDEPVASRRKLFFPRPEPPVVLKERQFFIRQRQQNVLLLRRRQRSEPVYGVFRFFYHLYLFPQGHRYRQYA